MKTSKRIATITGAGLAAAATIATIAGPGTVHADPQGFDRAEVPIGYVYGTFNDGPNMTLLVGGSADDFCDAKPEDPFNAEPGMAMGRTFSRIGGVEDLMINDKDQPIYLYDQTGADSFDWLINACATRGEGSISSFATGTADLKVRDRIISPENGDFDFFNSVNGELIGSDGAVYRVRASADFSVRSGELTAPPPDFVKLEVKRIKG